MQVKIFKHSPKIRTVTDIEIEIAAKEEYSGEDYLLWREANKSIYTTEIVEAGTGTVVVFDEKKLNTDFKNLRLSEWNIGLPDRNERLKKKRYEMEADTNELNTSIITDHPYTPESFKTKNDPLIWNMGNTMGNLIGAFQKQVEEIGSLTVALENQKIAYNEEVDNLYTLVNAIIVALLAVGGVSGWSTIRRKRKGT